MTKLSILLPLMLLTACDRDHPPAPTSEQSDQLNETEELLNEAAEQDRSE
jgi:hypothetical protein